MKVVMMAAMAGPQGTARRGKVLDLPNKQAEELVAGHFARPYDHEKDKKRDFGLDKPEK